MLAAQPSHPPPPPPPPPPPTRRHRRSWRTSGSPWKQPRVQGKLALEVIVVTEHGVGVPAAFIEVHGRNSADVVQAVDRIAVEGETDQSRVAVLEGRLADAGRVLVVVVSTVG